MTRPAPTVTEVMLRRLLSAHAPDLAAQPLRPLRHDGTETRCIRIGADHLLRMPHAAGSEDALRHAARWLPVLAPCLPLQVPEVVAHGEAGPEMPVPWVLQRWLPGRDATREAAADQRDMADRLSAFVAALRGIAVPPDAPRGRRGGPLAPQDAALREALARARAMGLDEAAAAGPVWEVGLAAPAHDGRPVWLHADLMPANLILRDGHLAGVIDWSDLTTGDPAYDLIPAWFLFDAPARDRFLAALGPDAATLARARARVAWQCALALPHYRDSNALMMRMARRGLAALADSRGAR